MNWLENFVIYICESVDSNRSSDRKSIDEKIPTKRIRFRIHFPTSRTQFRYNEGDAFIY